VSFGVRTVTGDWDYATLPENVRLGERCWIERPESFERFRSTRSPGVVLGDDVRVYGWTVFNVEPGGVVTVGDGSVLVGAVFPCQEEIAVGRDVVISYQVTIADSDFHRATPRSAAATQWPARRRAIARAGRPWRAGLCGSATEPGSGSARSC
jgi:hypothetical protein